GIAGSDVCVGGNVCEDGIAEVAGGDAVDPFVEYHRGSFFQALLPVFEVDAVVVEVLVAAFGQADHAQLDAELFQEPGLLLAQLIEEAAADVAGAGDEQVQLPVGGLEELFVEYVDGFPVIGRCDDGRDISFGGPLCDGADVDAVAAQGAEE